MPFYMQINNIPGSSTEQNHRSWIELKSVDFGLHRNINTTVGNAQNRENTILQFGNFVITKTIDKSSPKLFEASCKGRSSGDVVIHACHSSKNGLNDYLQYTLSNVIVSHYDINGVSPNDDDDFMETYHLNFTKVEMKYIPRNPDNQPEAPIVTGYDLTNAVNI